MFLKADDVLHKFLNTFIFLAKKDVSFHIKIINSSPTIFISYLYSMTFIEKLK